MVLNDVNFISEFFMGFNSIMCILVAMSICFIMREYSKIITYDTLFDIGNFILCKKNAVEGFENYDDIDSPV
jgi:hypothetical protein